MKKIVEAIYDKLVTLKAWATAGKPIKNIKNFYKWDPVYIPNTSLPAITIRTPISLVNARWSRQDNIRTQASIRYVFNAKQYLWNTEKENVKWELETYDLFLEQDSNGCFTEDSIIWYLRKDLSLNNNAVLLSNFNFKTELETARGEDSLTFEGVLTFDVEIVNNR